MAPRVVVFLDYQNAYFSAREVFRPTGVLPEQYLIDPAKLARLLVRKRTMGGLLQQVRVYRGRPEPRREARLTAATDRQAAAWGADPRVKVIRRTLWYPRDFGQPSCHEKPREKGIDVSLAVDMVRMAIKREYEVAILFSRDTDLLPAVEAVAELRAAHVEVATWAGTSQLRCRLPDGKLLWCHKLSEADFQAVRDTRSY